jgi:hypothetical protein
MEDTLVVATPLSDMLEASGFEAVKPNRFSSDEDFLQLLVRIGIVRDSKWKPSSRAPRLAGMRKVAEFLRPMADFDLRALAKRHRETCAGTAILDFLVVHPGGGYSLGVD